MAIKVETQIIWNSSAAGGFGVCMMLFDETNRPRTVEAGERLLFANPEEIETLAGRLSEAAAIWRARSRK